MFISFLFLFFDIKWNMKYEMKKDSFKNTLSLSIFQNNKNETNLIKWNIDCWKRGEVSFFYHLFHCFHSLSLCEEEKKSKKRRNKKKSTKPSEAQREYKWFTMIHFEVTKRKCILLLTIHHQKNLFLFDKTQIPFYLFIFKWMKIKKK
jgi:hypothetical protein